MRVSGYNEVVENNEKIMVKKLPQGIKKHIRQEKARLRKQVPDTKEQEKLIAELNSKFLKQDKKQE